MANSLIQELVEAIDLQQQQQNRDYDERMQKPLSERIVKGYTMANLSIDIDFYNGLPNQWCSYPCVGKQYIDTITVKFKENISRFREGATVRISNGIVSFQMIVEKDGVNEMILKSGDFDVKNNIYDTTYRKDGWEINEVNISINQKLLRAAADRISSNSTINNNMELLFAGRMRNEYISVNPVATDNASQDEAIRKAIGCTYFHLIQGPPGTGKTYTVANIVRTLVGQGKKVFVSGPTHTAINNCLNAVSRCVRDKSKIVKIGEKYQAEELLGNEFVTRKTRLPFDTYVSSALSMSGIVIGATPYALCYPASKKLQGWEFDYVIIDEAAQMSMPLALAAMSYGKKLVFVGDHKQLDPIMPSNTRNWLFSDSIFKKLVDLYPHNNTLLNLSYRLCPSLIKIPSELFYNSSLKSAVKDPKGFVNYICKEYSNVINNPSNEVLFLHHEFDSLGRSPYEAKMCASIVASLLDNHVSISDIAMITPYRAQVREIRKALVNAGLVDEEDLETIFVDTIERMQGQEKKFVIFSLSNSKPDEVEDRLEFFYSANRLNVAITRATDKTIIITNEKVFKICEESISNGRAVGALAEGMNAYLSLYNMSTKIEAKSVDEDW